MKFFRLKRIKKLSFNYKNNISPLIDVLNETPYKFSLVKALDLVTRYTNSVIIKDNLRFSSKYSQIAKVEGIKDHYIELYTNLPSILGIDGTLPNIYTEKYVIYNKESKDAVIDFFNIFNSRYVKLNYKFLKTHEVSCLSDTLENTTIGKILIKMSGYENFSDFYKNIHSYMPIQFAIATHNLFWQENRSANGLRILLKDFFNVPIKIKEFVPKLVTVDIDDQTRIGVKKCKFNILNESAILDRKCWNITDNINVIIGPLDFNKYIEFLPKSNIKDRPFSNLQKLKDLIKIYVPINITVNIRIYLNKCKVNGTILNRSRRLNIDSFILGENKYEIYFQEII